METPTQNRHYFNKLSLYNKNDNLLKILLEHRSVQRFSPYRICYAEHLMYNSKQPPTLKEQSLLYLHKNLCTVITVNNDLKFYNYMYTADLINSLTIPRPLKYTLLYLYINCPRHVLLVDRVPNLFITTRYSLIENSPLFNALQTDNNWEKINNFKMHDINDLTSLVEACNSFPMLHNRSYMIKRYLAARTKKSIIYNKI